MKSGARTIVGHRASLIGEVPEIIDQRNLTLFRGKRGEWFRIFETGGPDRLSIQGQLLQAIVDDLTYRVFTQESSQNKDGEGLAIPSLRYLLNVGYVTSQALLSRRLLDSRKDVSSIKRIVKDLRKHRRLITRENFVSFDGTPYTYNLSSENESSIEFKLWGLQAPGFSDQLRSYHRHERFDELSKVPPTNRTRNDLIDSRILHTIEMWLESPEANHLKDISDSRFAHATDGSHSQFRGDLSAITLHEVEKAQRGFVMSTRAIFDVVLNSENHSEVVPHLPLGSFGRVWSGEQVIDSTRRMQEHWDELVNQRNSWGVQVDDELYQQAFA